MRRGSQKALLGAICALALGLGIGMTVVVGAAQGKSLTIKGAYNAARAQWKASVCQSSAQQTNSTWPKTANILLRARPLPRSYRAAAARLRDIARLPETGATAAQGREFTKDAKYLDGFFHTPGLYVTPATVTQCPY